MRGPLCNAAGLTALHETKYLDNSGGRGGREGERKGEDASVPSATKNLRTAVSLVSIMSGCRVKFSAYAVPALLTLLVP